MFFQLIDKLDNFLCLEQGHQQQLHLLSQQLQFAFINLYQYLKCF